MSTSGLGFQTPLVPLGPPAPFLGLAFLPAFLPAFLSAFLSSFLPAFLNERRNKFVAQVSRSNHYEASQDVDNTDD